MARIKRWFGGIIFSFVLMCQIFSRNTYGYILASDRGDQLDRLSNYDIVTPHLLAARQRRHPHTATQDGHLKEATFVVPAFGKELTVDVQLNENLFPQRYIERSYADDGEPVTRKPHVRHHCYYHGHVRDSDRSSVAISTCHGIRGVINVEGDSFYIEPLKDSSHEHLVYRPQDRLDQKLWHFDVDTSHRLMKQDHAKDEERTSHHRIKKDIHSETKYIELVIVNDYHEYLRQDENVHAIEERSKEIANIMDMIYRPMNVRVALVGVVTWTQGDLFEVSTKSATTMAEFQRWRNEYLLDDIKNDNAQFLTAVSFEGSTVGMASLGTMCSDERSAGVSQDHDENLAVIASTMAHEMGHNLGFMHDSLDSTCVCDAPSNVGCVMEPSSGPIPPVNFSSCSYNYLEGSLEKGLGACLFDYPDMIFDGPICGNGFLEFGEECDCGTPEECNNDCCIPETCRLHKNATCAIGECCEDCQLKKAGEICRELLNECDLPEYCTGVLAECPANVYRQNGETCADSTEATCYDGQCLTLDSQCESIWGPGAKVAHEACFDFNQQGSSFGNCGGSSTAFQACAIEDVGCGKLMCEGGKDYPILTSLAKASQGYIWDSNSQQHTCKSASIDLGQDVPDPGYVATGSICKPGFVCSAFKCQNLTKLNVQACPNNCYGNGVCNSKNHCHCDSRWNPPLCNTPGFGGSIDSGPARQTDQSVTPYPKTPSLNNNTITHVTRRIIVRGGPDMSTVIILLVMFLCVLPGLALIGILVYCKRGTLFKMASKGSSKQMSSSKQYSSNSAKSPTSHNQAPSHRGPARPAPVKPTIQHTHLRQGKDEPRVFQFPAKGAASMSAATPVRPPPPAPVNKPREPTQLQRPPPPKVKPPASSVSLPKAPSAQTPIRPSPTPPAPPQKPPSPSRSAAVPPATSGVRPQLRPVGNKPQFRLPPPTESSESKTSGPVAPPQRPARPVLRPPSVSNAREALKPVVRAKPNMNRNNSKESEELSTVIATPEVSKTSHETLAPPKPPIRPAVPKKPVPSQKPAVPSKPAVPGRPPSLKFAITKDPVV